MRVCLVCETPLEKREGEKPSRFRRRKTCGEECAHDLLRRSRPDTRFKGDDASSGAKGRRGRRAFPLGRCEAGGCEASAVDHHHVDGNTGNNARENIECLCRKHHRHRHVAPLGPCRICGGEAPLGKRVDGRCLTCKAYFNRTGRERPWKKDGRKEGSNVYRPRPPKPPVICSDCGIEARPSRKGRCGRCNWRHRHNRPVTPYPHAPEPGVGGVK